MAIGYPDYIFTLWNYLKELVDINKTFLIYAVLFSQNIWWIYVLVKVHTNFSKFSILAIGYPDYIFTFWTYSKKLVDINKSFLFHAVWFSQNIWWGYIFVKVHTHYPFLKVKQYFGNWLPWLYIYFINLFNKYSKELVDINKAFLFHPVLFSQNI